MLVAIICLAAVILNWSLVKNPYLQLLAGLFPAVLVMMHAVWTLGLRRGLGFLVLAAGVGLLFEVLGLRYSIFGHYLYQMDKLSVLGVPVVIVLLWAVFIYVGYAISNSFLFWLNCKKPDLGRHNWLLLLALVLADGIVVTAIDLFADPLQVHLGSWVWLGGGGYFGVPAENFLGWFFVAVTATGIFRVFEYFNPRALKAVSKKVFLIPLAGYVFMVVCFIFLALNFHMEILAVCGSFLMLAIAALNFGLYEKRLWLRKM